MAFESTTTTLRVGDAICQCFNDDRAFGRMRVADGVTLHKDGKHTINMGGFDVRSDGQISTEVGGFRFSSGGGKKEEKSSWFDPKEETDWFGNKKKEPPTGTSFSAFLNAVRALGCQSNCGGAASK